MRLPAGRARDLLVLGGTALVLRLAWVLVYGRADAPEGSINDTTFYLFTAAGLAHGHYTGLDFQPTAGWPPGFPFAVSVLYRAFGLHRELALFLNVALATATVVLIYLIADRVFDRRVARVAAAFFAILPGPLLMTGLVLSETTYIFELVGFLALVVFLPDRRWTPLVLGVAAGLAALTRGEGLLIPIIPLAVWWGVHSRPEWARRAALLLVAMALTVAPWTIRNVIVMDGFVLVGNNPSQTLWAGHNPRANGWIVNPDTLPDVSGGGSLETRRANALRHEAIEWAIHNPLKELGLIPRRLIMLNQGAGGVIGGWLNAGQPYEQQLGLSSIRVFGVLTDAFSFFLLFAALASLTLTGGRRLWRNHPAMRGVLAYLGLSLFVFGVVYYGQWRYRIPMEPFMVLIASPLLVRAWDAREKLAEALGRLGAQARLVGD